MRPKYELESAHLIHPRSIMKLFGHPDSGHAYKVRLMLCIAEIDHEYELIDINTPRHERTEEFQMHARFGEVPLLLDGAQSYVQSNAILIYLANKSCSCGAESDSELQQCLEWLAWEANKIGMCLPQLRSKHKFGDTSINDGAAEWLMRRYEHDVNILNEELSDGRDWIINSTQPTIADCSLSGYLYFASEARVDVPAHVAAWLQRLSEVDGWQHPYTLMASQ